MDKRDLSTIFRERLKMLLTRSDLNQSAFATAVGIDRSALSQLLSGASTRLPRAETLLNIAAEFKVSLDWLVLIKEELGRRWLEPDLFRFGASGLLTDIERQLEHHVSGRYSAAHRHAMA